MDFYIDVDQLNLDKFKNLETLVLKNCKLYYGEGTLKPIYIKELHYINKMDILRCNFLSEDYISKYPQHFPSLEKLVIDQSGAPFSMVWKIKNITKILDFLASFKYIHLKITTEVFVIDNFWFLDEPDPMTAEERRQILEKALEIICEKFPIESEIELVDGTSGLSIVKEKWEQPEIQQIPEFKMAELLRSPYYRKNGPVNH